MKEAALERLSQGDTASAQRILELTDWRKSEDPELPLLLGRLHRQSGTIRGRLRSQRVLEHAKSQFPNDARIMIELGKTYYAQTFYPDAERCFLAALASDSTACEASFLLGLNHYRKWKRNQQFQDELRQAAGYLKDGSECAPSLLDRAIKHAIARYALQDTSLAARICENIVHRDSTAEHAHMLLGVIAFENGRFEQSSRAFHRGLSLLTDEEKEPYLDVSILLPLEERGRYENASIEEQERFRRRFWIERDPDPTTPLNERYLEHLQRTYAADLFYSNERPPLRGWETERGKAIIKLGWPSEIDRTLSNVVGQSPNLSGWAEIWKYGDQEDAPVLLFLDEFLNGNFTIPRAVSCSHMVRFLYHTPRMTTYRPRTIDIPGAFDVVSFKNGPFSSSAYLAAKIDVDSLEGSLVSRVVDQYVLRGILFDADWRAYVHFADTLSRTALRPVREADRRWLYTAREILLPFQEYRLSCVFSCISGGARAIYRGETDTSKYLRDSLTVSDILLHRTPEEHPGIPLWEREGRRFLPNPGHAYYPGEKLYAYLEIYNLSGFRSRTEYDLSYMIFEHTEAADEGGWRWLGRGLKRLIGMEKERRPTIIQTIRRSGYGNIAKEAIAINIDSLEIGRYILRVRVSDRLTGETTEAIAVFSKMSGS